MRKVLIFDTSVLCVLLEIPNMDTCGPSDDPWNKQRIDAKIKEEAAKKTTFVLPLAGIIETGNHIAQANERRWECGQELGKLIRQSVDQQSPWAAFSEQAVLWSEENLKRLADAFPPFAAQGISLGDAMIKDVADYYAKHGYWVELLTGDKGLEALTPAPPANIPRRRR